MLLNAKATQIKLILKDAGRTLVQVVDNGIGMSPTDARLAFERHATSKIRVADDLFSLQTKGFRGEALASIAAIAQVEMTTCQEGEEIGTAITIEGNKITDQYPTVTQREPLSREESFLQCACSAQFPQVRQCGTPSYLGRIPSCSLGSP